MKNILVYITFFMATTVLNAQNSHFFKLYDTGAQDKARLFTRTCDKGFILGGITASIDAAYDAYIIKLDSNGNKLWNWDIGFSGASDGPVSIMETPDSNIIVFMYSMANNVKLRMAVLDYDGNLVFEKHDYYISDGFPEFSIHGAMLLPDNRIVTPVVVNDSILKVYWWNQTGDTLSSLVLDSCRTFPASHKICFVNCFLDNDTMVFCYNSYIASDKPSRVTLKTDYDGNLIDIKELYIYGVEDNARTVKGNSDNYMFVEPSYSPTFIKTCLYDGNINSVITWINYSSPVYDIITDFGADFISEDTVLFCGSISNYGNMDYYAHILKIDTSSNVVWQQIYKPYGYNKSYLWSVKQYEDCIAAVGYVYNSDVFGSYDILFVKADLNGNATSITTFEKPDNTLTVFPNPASDLINVNLLPVGESVYTIVDAGGRELLKGKTPGNQISISSLPAGCYQLLWENDGKKYCAGFVKE
mgnify:CR=1 FL=1